MKHFIKGLIRDKKSSSAVALSEWIADRIKAVFGLSDQPEARRMLVESCSRTIPFMDQCFAPKDFDRIRAAIIKLSDGDLAELRKMIFEAHKDWRDVLLAAGFGHDIEAHLSWFPDKN